MDTEIKYKVCKNNSETAEKAPHLIKFISNGTVSAEELAKLVHKNNPAVQEADAMLFLRTMNELVYELMVEGDGGRRCHEGGYRAWRFREGDNRHS